MHTVKVIAKTSTRGVKYSLLLIVDLKQEGKNSSLFTLESYVSQLLQISFSSFIKKMWFIYAMKYDTAERI